MSKKAVSGPKGNKFGQVEIVDMKRQIVRETAREFEMILTEA